MRQEMTHGERLALSTYQQPGAKVAIGARANNNRHVIPAGHLSILPDPIHSSDNNQSIIGWHSLCLD